MKSFLGRYGRPALSKEEVREMGGNLADTYNLIITTWPADGIAPSGCLRWAIVSQQFLNIHSFESQLGRSYGMYEAVGRLHLFLA